MSRLGLGLWKNGEKAWLRSEVTEPHKEYGSEASVIVAVFGRSGSDVLLLLYSTHPR